MKRVGTWAGRAGPVRETEAWGALVPAILAGYLFVHGCGDGKSGFVFGARAWGVSVVAAWCSA